MTLYVPEQMLRKVTAKKLSPVDVVMGDHWGEIVLGNPLRLSLLNHVFRQFEEMKSRGGAKRVRRLPQSLVKVIKNGGTSSKASLKAQIKYLQKDGKAEIELSDLYFGAKLTNDEFEAFLESWQVSGHSKGDYDFTHHIVVSFPPWDRQRSSPSGSSCLGI